jgi:outer membrane biosynthesis protein TonB
MAKLKSKLNLTLAFVAGLFGFTNNAYAQDSADAPKSAGSTETAKTAAKGSLSAGAIAAAVAAAAAIAAVADSGGGGSAAPVPTPAPTPAPPAPTPAPTTAPAPTPAPTYIVEVTTDDPVVESQVINTTTSTSTETNRNTLINTNTNTTLTTQTNINKAIATNTSTLTSTNTNATITTTTQTTTDTEGDGVSYLSDQPISVDNVDADRDTGIITMDVDDVMDADVDGTFEVTSDADLVQIMGDKDIIVDEVMDVEGVVADVDTGVNIVVTATSATP